MRNGREATGSWSSDDADRPRWTTDTNLVTEYDYCHENGSYAYSKLKGERPGGDKVFLTGQRRHGNDLQIEKQEWPHLFYNYEGLTHYLKGDGDEPELLYRLPELIHDMADRPEEPVFICEGEKDTDTLRSHGFIATTNPNGAGKWRAEFNPRFSGRDLNVMVDNDDRGRQHAAKVLAELQAVARSVRAVELPGLPVNGDVTLWLADKAKAKEDLLAEVNKVDADAPPSWVQGSTDLVELVRLASLSLIEYDRKRKAAAKALGITVATLDAEVAAIRTADNPPEASGTALEFPDIEPHAEPVAGPALLEEIVAALKRHVTFPSDAHAVAVALWSIHAHLLAEAEHTPRLHITAPTKGCGKTVLLNTVAALVPRPLRVEHVTPAALFRVIEEHHPTLMIDEVDTFLKDNEDMRGLLNAGHQPDTRVVRCVGENQEVRGFSVFAATALAGIGEIPATIEDRSITVPLRRRMETDDPVERLRRNRDHLALVTGMIARWVADNRHNLSGDPELPDALGDRAQDNWRLLVAIADAMSPEVGERARAAALSIELEKDHDDSDAALMALADVHALFVAAPTSKTLSSQHLVDGLAELKERPWPRWSRGNPLTAHSLARLLKPFGVKSKQIKKLNGKGYERSPVEEAFRRYCTEKEEERIEVNDPL